jgi:hypothetical protein
MLYASTDERRPARSAALCRAAAGAQAIDESQNGSHRVAECHHSTSDQPQHLSLVQPLRRPLPSPSTTALLTPLPFLRRIHIPLCGARLGLALRGSSCGFRRRLSSLRAVSISRRGVSVRQGRRVKRSRRHRFGFVLRCVVRLCDRQPSDVGHTTGSRQASAPCSCAA